MLNDYVCLAEGEGIGVGKLTTTDDEYTSVWPPVVGPLRTSLDTLQNV